MPRKINRSAKIDISTVNVLNAINNDLNLGAPNIRMAGDAGGSVDPIITTAEIRAFGSYIFSETDRANRFLSALYNRIGFVLFTSKMWENPYKDFEKGLMEFGETVENIFVDLGNVYAYDPAVAETEVFKRVIPPVKAEYYPINSYTFYKFTVNETALKQAFLSITGVSDIISKIIETMYKGYEYDSFLATKYLIAYTIINGGYKTETITIATKDNLEDAAALIGEYSDNFTELSTEYNPNGVYNHCTKEDQRLITVNKFGSKMNVKVLAAAFNLGYVEFMGIRKRFKDLAFSAAELARLAIIFKDDENYKVFTAEEIATLAKVQAVLIDVNAFQIYITDMQMREETNGQGLYRNNFLHIWKTYAMSGFANGVAFATA